MRKRKIIIRFSQSGAVNEMTKESGQSESCKKIYKKNGQSEAGKGRENESSQLDTAVLRLQKKDRLSRPL